MTGTSEFLLKISSQRIFFINCRLLLLPVVQNGFVAGELFEADFGHSSILEAADKEGILVAKEEEPKDHENHIVV